MRKLLNYKMNYSMNHLEKENNEYKKPKGWISGGDQQWPTV